MSKSKKSQPIRPMRPLTSNNLAAVVGGLNFTKITF